MPERKGSPWPVWWIGLARALTVGIAYLAAIRIPGLLSSFVAIFVALLPFDLIVSMGRLELRATWWGQTVTRLFPWVKGTVLTLLEGLVFGTVFGVLSHVLIPPPLGAALTVGLAYTTSLRVKGSISSYVSILGGVAVYERIVAESLVPGNLMGQVAPIAFYSALGIFAALAVGWGVGIIGGIITRLLLRRGYRMKESVAYDLPLDRRPLGEVLHMSEGTVVTSLTVEAGSPLDGVLLAEAGLRQNYGASVLALQRGEQRMGVPTGDDRLQAGDVLLVTGSAEELPHVSELTKGRVQGEG